MRIFIIILLFLPFTVFSQSVKIDGPTGRISDLDEVTTVDSADLIVVSHNDSSKYILKDNFIPSDHIYVGFTDSAYTLDITEDVWTQVTNEWDSLYIVRHEDGVEYVFGDSLKITRDGTYFVNGNLSFKGVNNEIWKIAVRRMRDGSATSQGFPLLKYTSVANIVVIPFTCILNDCLANDLITLEIMNTTDSDDCEVNGLNFAIKFFHQ